MTHTKTFRFLVADDEANVLESYRKSLIELLPADTRKSETQSLDDELFGEPQGDAKAAIPDAPAWKFDIVTVRQGLDAVAAFEAAERAGTPFSVAFLDVRMPPGIDGIETAARIRAIDPHVNIVIVTAFSDSDLADISRRVQPLEKLFYLTKPFHPLEIQQFANALSHKWDVEQALEHANRILEQQVGDVSDAFQIANASKEQAELANLSRISLIARTGTELRTPLNALIGFSQMIADESQGPLDNKTYLEYAQHIHAAGLEMLRRVEAIVDTSRYAKGSAVQLDLERLSVSRIMESLQRDFKKKAAEKGILFKTTMPASDQLIDADVFRLRKAFGHLLSHVVESTPKGGVVHFSAASEAGGITFRLISEGVCDGTAGETADPLPRPGVSGLKPAETATIVVAQQILELHDASLEFGSSLSESGEFVIRFPLRLVA